MNVAVEEVGSTSDGRWVGRGRDVVHGWVIAFVLPLAHRDRVVQDVRAGRRPVMVVPEVDALPWATVSAIRWE
jgi:hypothetical protein